MTFEVRDGSCGHCVSTPTKAVRGVDQDAKFQIELATHHVIIDPTNSDRGALSEAIRRAGYRPVAVEAGVERLAAKSAPSRDGCCSG